MISSELLSEVLGYEINNVDIIQDTLLHFNGTEIGTEYEDWETINIHELAHKCKEWARSQDINLEGGVELICTLAGANKTSPSYYCYIFKEDWIFPLEKEIHYTRGYTGPEAIFKACQWVLDNKDK